MIALSKPTTMSIDYDRHARALACVCVFGDLKHNFRKWAENANPRSYIDPVQAWLGSFVWQARVVTKKKPVVPSTFDCPFCNHAGTVDCKMCVCVCHQNITSCALFNSDKAKSIATIRCRICDTSYQMVTDCEPSAGFITQTRSPALCRPNRSHRCVLGVD